MLNPDMPPLELLQVPLLRPLTPAERLVAIHVADGLSNKEIARLLGKAEPTVKHQVSACLRKFGLSSRTRLMAALR
jgi:DNA-binding NarL/FixJ family response regulator